MCVYAVYQARVLRHKITYNVYVMLGNRQKITNGNRNQLADGNINQNGDNHSFALVAGTQKKKK